MRTSTTYPECRGAAPGEAGLAPRPGGARIGGASIAETSAVRNRRRLLLSRFIIDLGSRSLESLAYRVPAEQ
jgi:hypothetical protein